MSINGTGCGASTSLLLLYDRLSRATSLFLAALEQLRGSHFLPVSKYSYCAMLLPPRISI